MHADGQQPTGYPPQDDPEAAQAARMRNLAYAALAAQSGCFPAVFIIGALLVGLWLDAQLGQRGPITVALLLLSIPVSLSLMVLFSLRNIKRMTTSIAPRPKHQHQEEDR
ncbi:MAG: hypothetical protein SF162_18325 [bacterium]|nr:hypothetical protein [bacterium]